MNIHLPDERLSALERQMAEAKDASLPAPTRLASADTPLAAELDETKLEWLMNHVAERWEALHRSLGAWRAKMAKWERMSEMDYSDRVNQADPNSDLRTPDVFTYQNDTLGMSEGFVDFFTAQAKDDIFGTRPWLAATPEGRDDTKLAEQITKHAQWKLNQSDLEETLRDAIHIAAWGGTSFVKSRWVREEEVYKRTVDAAFSIGSGEAFRNAQGDFVTALDELPEGVHGDDVEWREVTAEETVIVEDNSCSSCLDYMDIAFDPKAPRLTLAFTDFFSRFRMGLLDVIAQFGIPREKLPELKAAALGYNDTARAHRSETNTADPTPAHDPDNANPLITLVEGFVRCDVLGNGKPVRIHVIFSPELHTLFSVDYLANVTPGGLLPVFPVRIHKIANRVLGIGYFEKYENANDSIDRKHNAAVIRTRQSAHVYTAIHKDALRDPNVPNLTLDPGTPFELAPDKTIDDLISFKVMPDMDNRTIELLNQQHQMAQMRSGITSAAQGEMRGVPSASTATGTRNIISRGAVLLKDPIDQLTEDVREAVEYNVIMLYANQDRDETFTWGEGRDAELLTIKAGDVRGLRANVSLTLVQAQNQAKLESAQTAIGIATSYVKLPETEKAAQRRLYVQAISTLGYKDADEIIRQAAADPEGILALMPPEAAPIVRQALEQAGLVPPEGQRGDATAPVVGAGGP